MTDYITTAQYLRLVLRELQEGANTAVDSKLPIIGNSYDTSHLELGYALKRINLIKKADLCGVREIFEGTREYVPEQFNHDSALKAHLLAAILGARNARMEEERRSLFAPFKGKGTKELFEIYNKMFSQTMLQYPASTIVSLNNPPVAQRHDNTIAWAHLSNPLFNPLDPNSYLLLNPADFRFAICRYGIFPQHIQLIGPFRDYVEDTVMQTYAWSLVSAVNSLLELQDVAQRLNVYVSSLSLTTTAETTHEARHKRDIELKKAARLFLSTALGPTLQAIVQPFMDKNDLRGSLLALDGQLLGQKQANTVLTLLNSAIADPKSYIHCKTVQDTLLHFATIASILIYLTHLKLATPPDRFPTMQQIKAGLSIDNASFLLSFPTFTRILSYLDEREHLLNAFRSSVFSRYVEKCLTENTYKATSISDIKQELLNKAAHHAQKPPDAASSKIRAFQAIIGGCDTSEQQEDERIYAHVISGTHSQPFLPSSYPMSTTADDELTTSTSAYAARASHPQFDQQYRNPRGECPICALSNNNIARRKAATHNAVDCFYLPRLATQDNQTITLSEFPTATQSSLPSYSKLLAMRGNDSSNSTITGYKRKQPSNSDYITRSELQDFQKNVVAAIKQAIPGAAPHLSAFQASSSSSSTLPPPPPSV